MSKLHICYAIDDNYAEKCLISIYDIILHKNEDTELDFLILNDHLKNKLPFYKFNSIDKVHVGFRQLNANAFIKEKDNAPIWYITGINRIRVMIPRLPEYKNVDKVLYLDADTLVTKDLTEVFNIDLGNCPIGICKNPVRTIQGFRCMQTFDYIDRCHILNSGVMLFNNNICLNMEIVKQLIAKMREDGNSNEHVISLLFYHDVKLLPPTLNFTPTMINEPFPHTNNIDVWNMYYGTHYKSMEDFWKDACILHFVGNFEKVMLNPKNKRIYNLSLNRLNKFLETGLVDKSFIPNALYYMNTLM